MKRFAVVLLMGLALLVAGNCAYALDRPETIFKIYQFPANAIPRIDGNTDDWSMVGTEYVIGTDQIGTDNPQRPRQAPNPESLDVKVRVGWVKGMSRLYFLYEAADNYWDFADPGMHNDTFEIVVDADRSGGPLIDRFHPSAAPARDNRTVIDPNAPVPAGGYLPARDAWYAFHGTHAQNYHIFTPAEGKDWCMAWGPQASWIKDLPYSNIAYNHNVKHGESGKVTAEFWITCFDYAGAEGPARAVESVLGEDKIIGLSWAIIDYDSPTRGSSFWNLSTQHNMFGQANELCAFRLMPLEESHRKPLEANWTFRVVDVDRRVVGFTDQTHGEVTSWKWTFGDGQTSTDQHPVHTYAAAGQYVVVLDVEGPQGNSRKSKVWDVTLR